MSRIVIVYHSGYGHTRKQAEAVHAGAAAVAPAELMAIDAQGDLPAGAWDTLAAADAIIFGSPHSLILSSGPATITERPE